MTQSNQPPLFRSFRALGYITDNVPFAIQRRGKETFVTVSVGKAWQVYNCGKLTLVLVGPQLPAAITALAVKADLTFAAVGNVIVECKRVHKSGVYQGHTANIIQLLVLGDLLLSLGADGQLLVWEIGNRSTLKTCITMPSGFIPTCMAHPDTYVNKVVVGSQGGQLALYNFITGNLLYTFSGWDGAGVKAVVSSPALDVVGVALTDGRAALLNLKFDETVTIFSNAAGVGLSSGLMLGGGAGSSGSTSTSSTSAGQGACTTLAFRSGAGVPLMAAGGGSGVITLWDLEQRRLHAVIQDAHDMPVTHLHFFAGEPLLMSAGQDNALKQWVFDTAEPKPRLLRFRSGHAAPPNVVRHYGEGLRLLSAGSDRAFRVFSTIQDQQSRELSQKHTARRAKKLKIRESELKLGRVTCLDACTVRERDWANVLTGHENDPVAYVWRLAHFTLGEHELRPPEDKAAVAAAAAGNRRRAPHTPSGGRINTPVTSVALSACGNFGVVGSAAGRVDRYNMQSGIHRGVYGRLPSPATGNQQQPLPLSSAHEGSVTGMVVDGCNKLLVTVGLDGWMRLWDFKTHKMRCEVNVGSACTHIAMAPGSGLVAVACDDLTLRCFDVEAAGRLVRRFKGHKDRITCIQLSSDGRWLMSSSMDGTLRIWDVPAAQCLQVLRLGAPLTSFSLAPSLDILATCHVNRRGIYLWSNQAVFGNPADFTHSTKLVEVTLPSMADGLPQSGTGSGLDAETEGADTSVEVSLMYASDEDEGGGLDDGEDEHAEGMQGVGMQGVVGGNGEEEDGGSAGTAVDPRTGAPLPLAPSLVTLSLLPRAQWHSLMHLESIKARNKPIQPPKKPEAAPFFLPTVAGLSGNPIFDTTAPTATTNTTAQGDADTDTTAAPAGSKIIRVKPQGGGMDVSETDALRNAGSEFVRLLRACHEAGDWASFLAHVRGLSPAALDREVRALQMLTDARDDQALALTASQDVSALLEAMDAQLSTGMEFEFVAALLHLVLQVHGDAILERPVLQQVASRVHKKLAGLWARVDGLLSDVRCMTAYFGNLQG